MAADTGHKTAVYEGRYLSGRAFFVAQCLSCGAAGILLNSGHHYQTFEAAERECVRHSDPQSSPYSVEEYRHRRGGRYFIVRLPNGDTLGRYRIGETLRPVPAHLAATFDSRYAAVQAAVSYLAADSGQEG